MTNAENARRFTAEIADDIKGIAVKLEQYQRVIGLTALNKIILRTPVDIGFAKGGWQTTIAAPSEAVVEREDPQGAAAKAEGEAVLGNWTLGSGSAYITNNLPYIETLEFGLYPNPPKRGSRIRKRDRLSRRDALQDALAGLGYVTKSSGGFSRQAPMGMVGVTAEELKHSELRI